jgi:hypothetical protein
MRREDLPIICYGAPILGLLIAGGLVENPSGNAPGGLQVAVAVGIPLVLSSFAARRVVLVSRNWMGSEVPYPVGAP